jgi:hypothetical protein
MQTLIQPGSQVMVRDAGGDLIPARALTGVVPGSDFPVVWVCRLDRWESAVAAGQEPPGVPCPAEDVTLAES